MSRLGKLIDKLYDLCFEKVPVKQQPIEDNKFYLPCNVLFGNIKREKENKENSK